MPTQYAGSCNPPRRAKRARTESAAPDEYPTPPTAAARRPRQNLLPKEQEAAASDAAEEEDDYDPDSRAAPKRRGRKSGSISRSARESLRKLNHSRIEKARRTKINDALSSLSLLVNEAERQKVQLGILPTPEAALAAGKVKSEEKEFKLDVLVKTVTYVHELIEKVKLLEAGGCAKCSRERDAWPPQPQPASASLSSSPDFRRKLPDKHPGPVPQKNKQGRDEDDDTYAGDDEQDELEDDDRMTTSTVLSGAVRDKSVLSSPLPSIASWLPHPYIDPSRIAVAPLPPTSTYLPSPPLSDRIRPATSESPMHVPSLTLPAPAFSDPPASSPRTAPTHPPLRAAAPPVSIAIPLPIPPQPDARYAIDASRAAGHTSASPAIARTPEDESAASLLLHMRGSRSSSISTSYSSSSEVVPLTKAMVGMSPMLVARYAPGQAQGHSRPLVAQTPSSLLGL